MTALLQDPTFWTAVAFIIFVAAVYKPAKRFILSGLDGRIAQIREEISEAQRLRDEAQSLLASYQRRQREAAQEADEILRRAQREVEVQRQEGEKALQDLLQRREQLAMEKIAQAEAAAVREVREMAVDLSITATERILRERLTGQASDRLVDNSIAELPKRLQ